MRPKSTSEEAQESPEGDFRRHRLPNSYDKPGVPRLAAAQTCVGAGDRRVYLRPPAHVGRRAAVPLPSITIQTLQCSPGEGQPGFFMSAGLSAGYPEEVYARRKELDRKPNADQFHDSELGDVYDLYNACNGALDDAGLLDVRKLKELSPQEAEAFDVKRLEEVWEHSSGCFTCKEIVRILNEARGSSK